MANQVKIIDWDGPGLMFKIEELSQESLMKLALQCEGHTKANIVSNDQVDTGFMLASVYAFGTTGSNYGSAENEAKSKNQNGEMLPEENLSSDSDAGVAVGAEYGIYQEAKDSFLIRGFESTLNDFNLVMAEFKF